ncbi:MAG: DUF1934 domain-containing protein [Ruminococcus sp.]|nr:DUF1934 domain-containing protein [Ruminococcus sp.]MCD8328450.1 DUF1934 domain-containing protein [Ruminococcus sp.]
MEEKNVLITFKTRQDDGVNQEEIEVITGGSFLKTDDGYVIKYEETEATGFDGCLTTLTVTGEEKVVLDRTGAVQSRLVIDRNKKHYCNYGTPYGSIQMGVQTGEIRSTLNDSGGDLFFKYVIDVEASLLGNYEVSINVKES